MKWNEFILKILMNFKLLESFSLFIIISVVYLYSMTISLKNLKFKLSHFYFKNNKELETREPVFKN
jgi:hypothetical protein